MPFPFLIYTDCLLYTSDAADDLLCVDLGGPRIIKKKKIYITVDPMAHIIQKLKVSSEKEYTLAYRDAEEHNTLPATQL